jgi:hypothetical protein
MKKVVKDRFVTIAIYLDGEWKELSYNTQNPAWKEIIQIVSQAKDKFRLIYN